jgi:hypothetical protein
MRVTPRTVYPLDGRLELLGRLQYAARRVQVPRLTQAHHGGPGGGRQQPGAGARGGRSAVPAFMAMRTHRQPPSRDHVLALRSDVTVHAPRLAGERERGVRFSLPALPVGEGEKLVRPQRFAAVQHHRRALGRVAVLVRVGRHGRDTGAREIEGRDAVPQLLSEGQEESAEACVYVQPCGAQGIRGRGSSLARLRALPSGPSPGRTDAVLESQSRERFDRVDDALWVVGRRCVPATPHT